MGLLGSIFKGLKGAYSELEQKVGSDFIAKWRRESSSALESLIKLDSSNKFQRILALCLLFKQDEYRATDLANRFGLNKQEIVRYSSSFEETRHAGLELAETLRE